MKRPVIGITCNYDYRDNVGMVSCMGITGQDWNFVSGDYVYILEKAGVVPVMLPIYKIGIEEIKPFLDRLDGIIITGGHDIGPEQYGMPTKGYCGTIMPMRDEQDVATGGTLYQDLEREGNFENHFGDKYPRNTPWHGVKIAEGTALEKIYRTTAMKVNSFHHQAVKDPGENVTFTAWSDDGVPEALELKGHPFALGVQWHPEMMYDSAEQLKLLEAFVGACK